MTKTVAFSWISPLETMGGGIERVTRLVMDGLTARGYRCLYLRHDTAADRFIFEGRVVGDLGEFLERHGVDTLVNQNGYSSAMTETLDRSTWRGRYVVCHHSEPYYLRKVFDLRGVVERVLERASPLTARLPWLARLVSYPLWQWLSTRRIAVTQARNYRRADRYVVLSPSFLPQLSRLLGQAALPKAVAIPNPLSFELGPDEAVGLAKRNEVLVVARLNDGEKRISATLSAWQIIAAQDRDSWTLRIVGDGPDADTLRGAARDRGLERVEFVGRADPLPYYRSAAIFLMTSRVEGWGLTLTEAMQTGTVPVAFDAYASLREILADGETGIVVANGDVAALAEMTVQLMRAPARRKALAGRAIEAAQRYRLDRVLNQWERIL